MPSDLILLSSKIPAELSPCLKMQVVHFLTESNLGYVVDLFDKIRSLRCRDLRNGLFNSLLLGFDARAGKAALLTVALATLSKEQKQELLKTFDKVLPQVQDSADEVNIVHNLVMLMDNDLHQYIDMLLDKSHTDIAKWSRYVDAVMSYDALEEVETESLFLKEIVGHLLQGKEPVRYDASYAQPPCFQCYEEELLTPAFIEFLKNSKRADLVKISSLSSFSSSIRESFFYIFYQNFRSR
jgi:hypothetical protein